MVNDVSGKPEIFARKIRLIFFGCALIAIFFILTVYMRKDWFGRPLDVHHEWLTAHSVCVTNNWLKEGALHLRFMHVLNPSSIEFETLLDRKPYLSYPPGAFIPVYLIAKVINAKDLITLYQRYNIFNHFLISIILFLIMFLIIEFSENINRHAIFFSIIPSMIYLFTPPTLYWHQNVFFADQAVILLFVIFVYLEIKNFLSGQLNRWNKLLLFTVVFLGALTDWLFIFVVFVAFLLRVLFSDKTTRFKQIVSHFRSLIIPAILSISLFLYQIIPLGYFTKVVGIYRYRGFHASGEDGTVTNFFQQHFVKFGSGYGKILCLSTVLCFFALTIYYIFNKCRSWHNKSVIVTVAYIYLIWLITLPCLFQVYFFQQHSIVHDFSALKWALPLSVIPFSVFPIIFIQEIKEYRYRKIITHGLYILWIILFLSGVIYKTATSYKAFFGKGSDYNKKIGEMVKRNVTYSDICFAFSFDIPVAPPQRLAYSGKRVYKIEIFSDAKNMLYKFNKKSAKGKIFVHEKEFHELKGILEKNCPKIYRDSDYYVCEMD